MIGASAIVAINAYMQLQRSKGEVSPPQLPTRFDKVLTLIMLVSFVVFVVGCLGSVTSAGCITWEAHFLHRRTLDLIFNTSVVLFGAGGIASIVSCLILSSRQS